jgi:hypothetical protein
LHSYTDHQGDALWENTFWDDVNETISQLDGTDDVLDVPRRKRFGMRGKSFLRKPVPKPSIENCITAVVRSDTSALASNNEMFCNGVTELKTNEFSLSTGPEKEMCVNQVTIDGRNPVFAGDMETESETDSIRNSLLGLSKYGDGSVTLETIAAASLTDSVMDTKSCNDPVGTRDMKTNTEISPVELDSLLIVAQNVNGPVVVESGRTLPEDCPSLVNDLVTCVSHESDMETESVIDLDALVAVPEDSVDPAISEVTKSDSLKILSEPLVEVSENITADGMLVDPDSNQSLLNALSEVSENSDIQVMRYVGSESVDLKDRQICNGFGPFLQSDESSNSEINFLPVSVVCCNTCTSDGSAHDLQLNISRGMFDVDGQDCEQFRQGVLIGDPSFMAQSGLSEGDNELQVNELFSDGNTCSTWLSSEQRSETSTSSYLSDISTDLLAQYDTQTAQEISPEKNNISCKTSHHYNNSDRKQNPGNYTGLIHSRKMMAQNCKVHYTCCSSKSNGKVENPCMQCNGGTDSLGEVVVAEEISSCHVLSKVSLDIDTEGREVSFPTVITLPSCTFERCMERMEISPVEVKRIETILWEGNIEEIIQPKEDSVDNGLSPQNGGETASKMVESYIQNIRVKTKNGHTANTNNCITGKKSKEGTELFIEDRMNGSSASTRTRNIRSKCLHPSGNTLTKRRTFPASQVARQLQRKNHKKLSLSYRRKAASLTSKERNKQMNSIV